MPTTKPQLDIDELLHHWGARSMPFAEGAQGELFLTGPMREALELLQQTAALRTVMLLSGPNGVGKSALVTSWLRAMEPKRFFPIVITHATLTGVGLLCSLLARLGQEPSVRPGVKISNGLKRRYAGSRR